MYVNVYICDCIYLYMFKGGGCNLHLEPRSAPREREFFIDNLLVRVHLIIEMILVDQPCAMGF